MFLVIPEIGLVGGISKYCIVGESGTEKRYKNLCENPTELAKLWRRENAKSLFITDYDSFLDSHINDELIIQIANSIDIPIQLFYNFRDYNYCSHFLNNNIYRVVIDCNHVNAKNYAAKILDDYYHSKVSIYYKIETLNQFLEDKKLMDFIDIGIKRFVINVDKIILAEDNLSRISSFALKNEIKLSIYRVILSAEQLWQLQAYRQRNIDSAIISKSLYENAFPCQKIWRKIEAKLEEI